MYNDQNCIVACMTDQNARGGSVALLRVSGKEAIRLAARVFKGHDLTKAPSHTVHFGQIVYEGEFIDEVLLNVFRAPHSYTGENVIEISSHASKFIIEKIIKLLIALGARHALPGEFSKRAFLNGKMDLVKAEAINALIAAKTKEEYTTALRGLHGASSKRLKELRAKLISVKSLIELEIDFMEDHKLELEQVGVIKLIIEQIYCDISSLLGSFSLRPKPSLQVVIVGEPNVGKSSLFNALLNADRALVSSLPGTTRDIVSETLVGDGQIEFTLSDTAGLRLTQEEIEKLGIEKAREKIKSADLVLYVFDITRSGACSEEFYAKLEELDSDKTLFVASKLDRFDPKVYAPVAERFEKLVMVSAHNREGLEELRSKIIQFLDARAPADLGLLTSERQRDILAKALESLKSILEHLDKAMIAFDLLAFEVQDVITGFELLIGKIQSEDYLEEIFSTFCIGK